MDQIGSGLVSKVQKLVQEGLELRVNFDNLDFRILANQVLTNHRNTDVHWINQYITFDRVPSPHLDDQHPLADLKELPLTEYLLSQEEEKQFRSNITVLVARVLTKMVPCFAHIKDAVPKHIPHLYSKEMASKSVIIGLPVQPFNQSKHADVIQYLDYLESFLAEVHAPENQHVPENESSNARQARLDRNLNGIKVPLGGDQLGRERVTGAKKLRLGCDSATARLEHIEEMPELWHAKQAFLSVSFKMYVQQICKIQWHLTGIEGAHGAQVAFHLLLQDNNY